MRLLGWFVSFSAAAVLLGCSGEEPEPLITNMDDCPKYTLASLQSPDFKLPREQNNMYCLLDPTADIIWGNSGWEIDAEGEHELFPKNQAEWDSMRDGATMLVLIGEKMAAEPGERGDDWVSYSNAIADTARQLENAANNQDKQAIFDLGGTLYRVCVACHTRYTFENDNP